MTCAACGTRPKPSPEGNRAVPKEPPVQERFAGFVISWACLPQQAPPYLQKHRTHLRLWPASAQRSAIRGREYHQNVPEQDHSKKAPTGSPCGQECPRQRHLLSANPRLQKNPSPKQPPQRWNPGCPQPPPGAAACSAAALPEAVAGPAARRNHAPACLPPHGACQALGASLRTHGQNPAPSPAPVRAAVPVPKELAPQGSLHPVHQRRLAPRSLNQ